MIIRDPLYNYLYLTKVEGRILDNRLFQRLRHISQNGAAYYTFPANHSCRFLHSLGTMEVAGRIVSSIFLNSRKDCLDEFVNQFEDLVKTCRREAKNGLTSLDGLEEKAVAADSKEVYAHFGLDFSILEEWVSSRSTREKKPLSSEAQLQFSKLAIFEAVRIAALLHDLGHFPYSHSLENAFKSDGSETVSCAVECFRDKHKGLEHVSALHEKVGICLLDSVLPEDDLNSFERLCRMIASKMLSVSNDSAHVESITRLLHSVIASNLDADRLDYCRRDPSFSGMELGAFDVDRITNNMVLSRTDSDVLCIVPTIKALPAVESFYHQRYLIYKHMLYHHGIMRMNELIRMIVHELVIAYSLDSPALLCKYLKQRHFEYLWEHSDDSKFFICTENWLFALLCDLREDREEFYEGDAEEDERWLDSLFLMIDTFVCRRSQNFITLTKRRNLYDDFLSSLQESVEEMGHYTDIHIASLAVSAMEAKGPVVFASTCENAEFKSHNLRVMFLQTKPRTIFNDSGKIDVKVLCKGNSLEDVAAHSPYLASLETCISNDQLFHIILFGDDIKIKLKGRVEDVKHSVINDLAQAICGQLNGEETS